MDELQDLTDATVLLLAQGVTLTRGFFVATPGPAGFTIQVPGEPTQVFPAAAEAARYLATKLLAA